MFRRFLLALIASVTLSTLTGCGGDSFTANAGRLENGLRGMRLAIDPGHGGIDQGAAGATGVTEAQLNLEIAQLLAKRFMLAGSDVLLTRKTADVNYDGDGNTQKRKDMNNRARLVKAQDPHVLVSVHLNKYPDKSVNGAQVFYQKGSEEGGKLARCIQDALNTGLDGRDRQSKPGDYFMLKVSDCPSVIVECGFLSNPGEEKKLQDAKYRAKLADCIYKGICEYLGLE